MNIFDEIQKNVFSISTTTFGYTAKWIPSEGGAEITSPILYSEPTYKKELDDNDYNVEKNCMEYQSGSFPGLLESVQRANNEKVKITFSENDIQEFWVKRCEKFYDGKTIKAYLQPL